MKELFFELGCEEIPARLVEGARHELGRTLAAKLDALGLAHEGLTTWATPRRLALAVKVAERQEDRREERVGPPAKVAFGPDGSPTKAALAFAERNGVPVDRLERVSTPKGEYLAVTVDIPGQSARDLLADALEQAVTGLTWPKAMRWGSRRETFIRPVHWIVALFGGDIVPVAFAGLLAGNHTRGHRFLAPARFEVHDSASWLEGLRRAYVEPDSDARRALIRREAEALAASPGGRVLMDETLLVEVSNLVEWPVPLLGSFEPHYLDIPSQVLVTSMKVHQKYFAVAGPDGQLLPNFVVVCGTVPTDPAVVVHGNGRVLRARLADARFFFEEDRGKPLEAFVPKLAERTFLKGLGTMLDKAQRIASLAATLSGELGGDADTARRAGLLAKADLSTQMVGEFPELQGEMGRDYARLSGEPEAVAQAIFEHYLPRFAGDQLPETPAGRAVALADRLDSVVGCFALGLEPSGSADPYALRRQALGVLRILEDLGGAVPLRRALDLAWANVQAAGLQLDVAWPDLEARLLEFFRGRLKAALATDHPTDLVEAALSVGFEDPADARGRLEALAAMKQTSDWDALAVSIKRIVKIASGEAEYALDPATLSEPAEQQLFAAYAQVRDAATEALDRREYKAAVGRLVALEPAIERFFDEVLVMSDVPAERERRLALLQRVAALFHRLAAFDKVST